MLLISSGGGDQMIFLGLNFQFRDFFGCENLESTFLGGFFCVCVFYQVIFSGNFLRLGNSRWDILGVNFWSRDFFWIVIFAPI